MSPDAVSAAAIADSNAKELLDTALELMRQNHFEDARRLFEAVRALRPVDDFVVRQLALATFKSKGNTPITAANRARELLTSLMPQTTNDPETVQLWAAIHRFLWTTDADRAALDVAIATYQRALSLKEDYYSGINVAWLLNVRASLYTGSQKDEAIADSVIARRVRYRVLELCEAAWDDSSAEPDRNPLWPGTRDMASEMFWMTATAVEAAVALDLPIAAEWQRRLQSIPAAAWMMEAVNSQLARLRQLLASLPVVDNSSR